MATPAIQPYVPRYVKMREQQRLDAAAASSPGVGVNSPSERPTLLPSSFPAPSGHRRSPLIAPHPLPRVHNHSLLLSTSSLGSSTSASSSTSSFSGLPASGLLAGSGSNLDSNNERRQSFVSFNEDRDLLNNDGIPNGPNVDSSMLCPGGLTPPTRPVSIYSARVPSPLSRSVTDEDHPRQPTLPDISVTPPPDQTTFTARLRNSLSTSSLRSHPHSHGHAKENQPAIPGSSTDSLYSNSSRNGSPNASLLSLSLVAGATAAAAATEDKLNGLEPPTRRPTYSRPRSPQSSLHSVSSSARSVGGSATSASVGDGELPSPRRPHSTASSSNPSRRSLPSLYEDDDSADDSGDANSSSARKAKTSSAPSTSSVSSHKPVFSSPLSRKISSSSPSPTSTHAKPKPKTPNTSRDPNQNWLSAPPPPTATAPLFSRKLALGSSSGGGGGLLGGGGGIVMPLSASEYAKKKQRESMLHASPPPPIAAPGGATNVPRNQSASGDKGKEKVNLAGTDVRRNRTISSPGPQGRTSSGYSFSSLWRSSQSHTLPSSTLESPDSLPPIPEKNSASGRGGSDASATTNIVPASSSGRKRAVSANSPPSPAAVTSSPAPSIASASVSPSESTVTIRPTPSTSNKEFAVLSRRRPVSIDGHSHYSSSSPSSVGRRTSEYGFGASATPAIASPFTSNGTELVATARGVAATVGHTRSSNNGSQVEGSKLKKHSSAVRSFEVTSRRKSYITETAVSQTLASVPDSSPVASAVPTRSAAVASFTGIDTIPTASKEEDDCVPPLPVISTASITSVASGRTNVSSPLSARTVTSEASTNLSTCASASREESAATSLTSSAACSEDGHDGAGGVSLSVVGHRLRLENGGEEDEDVEDSITPTTVQMGMAISTNEISPCPTPRVPSSTSPTLEQQEGWMLQPALRQSQSRSRKRESEFVVLSRGSHSQHGHDTLKPSKSNASTTSSHQSHASRQSRFVVVSRKTSHVAPSGEDGTAALPSSASHFYHAHSASLSTGHGSNYLSTDETRLGTDSATIIPPVPPLPNPLPATMPPAAGMATAMPISSSVPYPSPYDLTPPPLPSTPPPYHHPLTAHPSPPPSHAYSYAMTATPIAVPPLSPTRNRFGFDNGVEMRTGSRTSLASTARPLSSATFTSPHSGPSSLAYVAINSGAGNRLSPGTGHILDDAFYKPKDNHVVHEFGKKKSDKENNKLRKKERDYKDDNNGSGMELGTKKGKSWWGKMFTGALK